MVASRAWAGHSDVELGSAFVRSRMCERSSGVASAPTWPFVAYSVASRAEAAVLHCANFGISCSARPFFTSPDTTRPPSSWLPASHKSSAPAMQRLVVVAALLALIALTDAQTPSTTVADQIPVIGSVGRAICSVCASNARSVVAPSFVLHSPICCCALFCASRPFCSGEREPPVQELLARVPAHYSASPDPV